MGKRPEDVREKLSRFLDLPGDVITGLPRIELIGDREVRVEGHRGILSCGTQEVHVAGGKLTVQIRGEDLRLSAMNEREVLITGEIAGVDLI